MSPECISRSKRSHTPHTPTKLMSLVLTLLVLSTTSGCIKRIFQRDDLAVQVMQHAPPIRLDTNDTHHLVVMQAPSPGWSIKLDSTERTPTGKRVYITIRQPDPSYVYPQQIVEMRVLTSVRIDTGIEVVGRMLTFDEKTKGRGYAPVTIVGSFE